MSEVFRSRVSCEQRALVHPFVISYATILSVDLVTVHIERSGFVGQGESCPVPRYGETPEGVVELARTMCDALSQADDWDAIHDLFPAGAARNAVDCAWWDWKAKSRKTAAWQIAGLAGPSGAQTVFTVGIDTPEAMARSARDAGRSFPLLKVKLGTDDDVARLRAVRNAAPAARLIVDANEGWSRSVLEAMLPILADCSVEMVEQPLPSSQDADLLGLHRPVPICADESCHVASDVERLRGVYDMVNIKLDKTGGLTEALRLATAARSAGMGYMVGCMLGTSLAMAPALIVAQDASYVDLDAPLLIGSDRTPHLTYNGPTIEPASTELWG